MYITDGGENREKEALSGQREKEINENGESFLNTCLKYKRLSGIEGKVIQMDYKQMR